MRFTSAADVHTDFSGKSQEARLGVTQHSSNTFKYSGRCSSTGHDVMRCNYNKLKWTVLISHPKSEGRVKLFITKNVQKYTASLIQKHFVVLVSNNNSTVCTWTTIMTRHIDVHRASGVHIGFVCLKQRNGPDTGSHRACSTSFTC